jgi:hypothetical protein
MALVDEAVGAVAPTLVGKREALKFGKDNHAQVRAGEADLLCSLQPIDPRHAEIEKDKVRLVGGCELNRVQAVTSSPHDLKTAGEFQVITDRTKRCGGIVGYKNANCIALAHDPSRTKAKSDAFIVEERRGERN